MTGRGVPDDEMVNFPIGKNRPDVRVVDALLSGKTELEDAPAGLRPVAEVIAALQAPPDPGEFAGWSLALTAFREAPGAPQPPGPRRPPLFGARLVAAAAAAAAVALGGGIAAAYAGILPAALQRVAHDVIAAPPPHRDRPPAATAGRPVGPDVTGSAKHGLCTAYQHANPSERAVAFRKLAQAAGGEAGVPAYCGWASPSGDGHGRPGAVPSVAHSSHPGKPTPGPGKPTPGPGKPTATPGHGKPTAPPSHGNPTAPPSHGKKT
jgi:hypothetical protein